MANFFIIDHSLKDAGGHHFDYTRCMSEAAASDGFDVVVGANQAFSPSVWNANDCGVSKSTKTPKIFPVFRQTTYQRDSYLAGLRHLTRSDYSDALCDETELGFLGRLKHRGRFMMHRRRRDQFVRSFANDCQKFFSNQKEKSGDHVFLTTISELELMGLALYLANNSSSLQSHWHLQFHFNLFEGRTPEYEFQGAVAEAISACILAALSRLPYHSIHFYTTSETLADQYNRLGVCPFYALPYPISPEFHIGSGRKSIGSRAKAGSEIAGKIGDHNSGHASGFQVRDHCFESDSDLGKDEPAIIQFLDYAKIDSEDLGGYQNSSGSIPESSQPIRFTCPGGVRREKGQANYLQLLVDELWDSHLANGQIQLQVQRSQPGLFKSSRFDLKIPECETAKELEWSPVEMVDHPLPRSKYIDLIRSTDVGLLYYDSRVYFSRRAGVLGELLACGKPAIVPAGCWLGDQIEKSTHEYVNRMKMEQRNVRTLTKSDFRWAKDNVPLPGGVFSFDRTRHPFVFETEVDESETAVIVEFEWHWPRETGTYCRLEMIQLDSDDNELSIDTRVVGIRDEVRRSNTIFNIKSNSGQVQKVRFNLRNEYNDLTASLRDVTLTTLKTGEPLPSSQVAIVAADENDLIRCIREVVSHYEHYRQSAAQFSTQWFAQHDPDLTLKNLLTCVRSDRRVA